MKDTLIYTIGHSNHGFARFLELLRRHSIAAIADVRRRPYSRFNPHFNRDAFSRALAENGIDYLFFGDELGGTPRSAKPGSIPSAAERAASPAFRDGLARVAAAAAQSKVALVCAEKGPLHCHRALLVAPHLAAMGLGIRHILADGALETQEGLERRAAPSALPLFGD